MPAIKELSLQEWMQWPRERKGIWQWDISAVQCPELNVSVMEKFIELCEEHDCQRLLDTKVTTILDGPLAGLGVSLSPYMDPEDAQFAELEFPLVHQTCHPTLPVTAKGLLSNITELAALADHLGRGVYFESVSLVDRAFGPEVAAEGQVATPQDDPEFAWLNSPVCNLRPPIQLEDQSFEGWLYSINRKRRYKVREALADERFTLDVVQGPFDRRSLAIGATMLANRYGKESTEFEYALLQLLWFQATMLVNPSVGGQGYHVLNTDGEIVALAGFIFRDVEPGFVEAMFQCNVTDLIGGNVGAFMLASVAKHMHGAFGKGNPKVTIQRIDPTCRTGLMEADFDVYKRLICNQDSLKPLLCVLPTNSACDEAALPFFLGGEGWFRAAPGENEYGDPV